MKDPLVAFIQWYQGMQTDWKNLHCSKDLIPEVEEYDTNGIITHPSYDTVHRACESLAEQIKESNFNPDKIIGLSRGGLLPAVILSHMLNIPMRCVHYSSKDGNGDNRNHLNDLPEVNGKRILIVDDICDSGKTLEEVFKEYTMRKQVVQSAVLYYKDNPPGYMPDHYWHWIPENSPWIIFPFE